MQQTLNQVAAQCVQWWQALTPKGRGMTALAAAAAVVGLVLLFRAQVGQPDYYLLGGRSFSADEIPAIEAAFAKKGLSGFYVEGGRIRVSHGQQASYLAAMVEGNVLPSSIDDEWTKLSSQPSVFISNAQQAEAIKLAKQKMLARIIGEMDGIAKAYVFFDTKPSSRLKRETTATASVSVEARNGLPLEKHRILQIRRLVAATFAGLDPNSVAVIDLKGPTHNGSTADGGEGGEYLAQMTGYQEYYRRAVLDALAYVPGVTATIGVELDKRVKDVTDAVLNDPRSVPINTRENRHSVAYKNTTPPAVVADNQPASLPNPPQTSSGTEETITREETHAVSQQRSHVEQAALTPSKVTVAVGVPSSYYEQIWQAQHPATAGLASQTPAARDLAAIEQSEKSKILAAVAQVIPGGSDPDVARQRVTVTSFTHVTSPLVPALEPQPATENWLAPYGNAAGFVILSIVGLLLLRSSFRTRSNAAREPTADLPGASRTAKRSGDARPVTAENDWRTRSGSAVRDPIPWRRELAQRVQGDPGEAARILRGWMGQTAVEPQEKTAD